MKTQPTDGREKSLDVNCPYCKRRIHAWCNMIDKDEPYRAMCTSTSCRETTVYGKGTTEAAAVEDFLKQIQELIKPKTVVT